MALPRRLPDAPLTGTLKEEVADLIPALRAFARTFKVDPADGDDLVQETLVRALRSLDGFRPGTSLKSWLFTIMRNAFYTQYLSIGIVTGPRIGSQKEPLLLVASDQRA